MASASPHVVQAAARILQYVRDTSSAVTRFFEDEADGILYVYQDTSLGQRTVAGYVAVFNGGVIDYDITRIKQCDSSATGELGGLVKQLKRIECARNFLSEIRHPQPAPTPVYLDSQALVQAITKDGPHGLMKHEAKWIVRAREAVTRGIIQPILIPRHENIADPLTATRGPTDFIPMRDIMISMHQGALSEDEINHRLHYPHVRAARANVTARRTSAAQSAQQQDVRDHAQAAAGLG